MKIAIGLSRSDTWLSRAIRWFGKRKTGEARYSHAFIKIDDLVVEQYGMGLKCNSYEKRFSTKTHILYYANFLTTKERKELREVALSQLGKFKSGYGFLKIPLFALDGLFKTYKFTQWLGVSNFKVCSEWVAYVFYKSVDYVGFKNWRTLSPDDIDDSLRGSSIWKSEVISVD